MPGELQVILNDLHSIIYVDLLEGNADSSPASAHASLEDFLLDKARSRRLFIY